MSAVESKKILYRTRIEKQICVRCGINNAPDGYTSCDSCREKMRIRSKARMQNAIENGLCHFCKKKPVDKGVYCDSCRAKIRENSRVERALCKKFGICPFCRKTKLWGDEKTCPECKAKYCNYNRIKKYSQTELHKQKTKESYIRIRDRRRALGLCTQCGSNNLTGDYKMCGRCRAKDREKNFAKNKDENGLTPSQARALKGLCVKCDNPVKDGYKVCEVHYQALCDASHSRTKEQKNEWFRYF